jgi:hypothetical protein
MALDRPARTLAYGYGTGLTTQLSICPGGRRVLELVGDRPGLPGWPCANSPVSAWCGSAGFPVSRPRSRPSP